MRLSKPARREGKLPTGTQRLRIHIEDFEDAKQILPFDSEAKELFSSPIHKYLSFYD